MALLLNNEWPRANNARVQKKFLLRKKGKLTLESNTTKLYKY